MAVLDRNQIIHNSARNALERILPRITTSLYGQLPSDTVPNLCRLLNHTDENFVLQILVAIGSIGDGRAVYPVEQTIKHAKTPHVREAAEQILPILKERQNRENASATLIRASNKIDATPDVLLHPATTYTEAQKEQLLRADKQDE
ncbi:MAG TPA: hypothetical protein VKU00_14420 [Chthonomonadaceae bacterium]|nr:hypothetical protein [Chthonomonadaceae bacterium]